MGDARTDERARKIYMKYMRAVRLMNQKPWKPRIAEYIITDLIKKNEQFEMDDSTVEYIRFAVKEWNADSRLAARERMDEKRTSCAI